MQIPAVNPVKCLSRALPLLAVVWAWGAADTFENIDLKVSAYMDGGRFQLKNKSSDARDGEILSRCGARWDLSGRISDALTAYTNLHWLWWRNQVVDLGMFHVSLVKFDSEVEAFLNYKPSENHSIKGGLFEFKYNPDSKNLGEHMLRSEAYPFFLESSPGVDLMRLSYARVAGVQHHWQQGELSLTSLLYLEQTNIPINDMSMALFAGFQPIGFNLSAGFSVRRMFKFGHRVNSKLQADAEQPDSTLINYIDEQGLNTRAVNLMLRGHVNIAELTGMKSNFKVYTEATLMGTKNDTLYYKSLFERLPLLLGIEFPTNGILDMFSIEFEYLNSPHYDKKYSLSDVAEGEFSPLPSYITPDEYSTPPDYHRDDLKWTVNLAKSLSPWLDLTVRAANDHLRLYEWNKHIANVGRPVTRIPKDWYVFIRLEWHN